MASLISSVLVLPRAGLAWGPTECPELLAGPTACPAPPVGPAECPELLDEPAECPELLALQACFGPLPVSEELPLSLQG